MLDIEPLREDAAALKTAGLNPLANNVAGRVVLVCGASTATVGVLVLVGWALGSDTFAALGSGYVPMAPNTALLVALLGGAVLLREVWPASRSIHLAAAAAAVFSVVVASMTLLGPAIGVNIDHWLFDTPRLLGAVPIGHMSPVTAFCLGLAGVSLFLLERKAKTWAAVLGALIAPVGAVCLIGYWLGVPLLYGGTVIPVALLTSLALIVLGIALTAAARPDPWPLGTLIGAWTLAIFAMTCLMPSGYALWLLYLIPLAFTAWTRRSPDPVGLAAACTVLMVAGFLLSPPGTDRAVEIFNRALGVLVVWTAAVLLAKRKQAEERLRASEVRYRRLFESAKDGILILDAETGRIEDVNPFLVELLGFPREQFLGKKLWELGFFKDIVANEANFLELQQKGYVRYENLALEGQDGHRHEVEFVSNVYLADHQKVIQCNIRDITERKQAEKMLAARLRLVEFAADHSAEELLQRSLDEAGALTDSPVGFYHFVEPDGVTLSLQAWSTRTLREFCTAKGKGRHYPVGEAGVWADAVRERRPVVHNDYASLPGRRGLPPGHAPVVRELVVPILREERVVAILGVGNKPRDYTPGEVELVRFFADVVWEVVERKRAEDLLRASHERLTFAEQATHVGFWDWDMATGEMEWSQEFYHLFGLDPGEEASLDAWLGVVHPDDREQARAGLDQVQTRRGVLESEYRIERPDGERRISSTGATYYDKEGRPVRRSGICTDVTARKLAEAEKERLEASLRQAQKMEAVGTLAGGIAHDFNNILTPIIAHTELALMELDDSSPVREDLDGVLVAAGRAADLVRQILVIGRREQAGGLTPVSLGPLIKEMAKFLRASLPATIEVRIEVDPACGSVLGDVSQIHQILLNLCTNAGYAMQDKGGVLTVSLNRADGERQGLWARLSVRDTGPGIPKDVIGRIFEPYYTTKPVGKGSGLGLAVVQGIVAKLGGEIRVGSEPGEGTTFEVLLPETEREGAPGRFVSQEIPRGMGQHVLVVDDEVSIRMAVRRMLVALGYRVTECPGGAEALVAFRADPVGFDAVLTDYTMPRMTGLNLAGEMLRLRPDLPIVLGTGFSAAVDAQTVAESGVRGLMIKPYDMRKLAEALRVALGGKG